MLSSEKNKINPSEIVPVVEKGSGVFLSLVGLVILIVFLMVIYFIFAPFLPNVYKIIFTCFLLLIILLSAVSIIRISRVNIRPKEIISNEHSNIQIIKNNEKVVAAIPNIHRFSRQYSILGAGKVINNENCLIITTSKLIFITVPLAGTGKIIADNNPSDIQWLVGQKELSDKLDRLIGKYSLKEIVSLNVFEYSINKSEITDVVTNDYPAQLGTLIRLKTSSNKKYIYIVGGKFDTSKFKDEILN